MKKHVIFSTILFSLLLMSCISLSLTSNVYASEIDVQDKTMEIVNTVIGLNTKEYAIGSNSHQNNQYLNRPQKEDDITLMSTESKVRIRCSLVGNNLRQIYISSYEGKISKEMTPANTIQDAKSLLTRYQNFVGDSFYGELASTLNNLDPTKNTTKCSGNIRLSVLNLNQKTIEYVWRFVDENGIGARSKNVILSYENGQLQLFLNNWPLYTVTSKPEISGDEATSIALEATKNYSYEIGVGNDTKTVTGFNVATESLGHETLSYINNPDANIARGGDPFILYPSWYVPIGFDKAYPGGVTGIKVTIWADTGEVSNTNPMVIGVPNNASVDSKTTEIFAEEETVANGFNQTSSIVILIVITTILTVFGLSLGVKKRTFKLVARKNWFPTFGGTLLCAILLVSLVIVVTPTVNANTTIPDSKSEIYASLYGDPNQFPEEKDAIEWVCEQIEDAFEESGYNTSNLAGAGTINTTVYYNAHYDENHFDRVTVFHFGHMISPNFGYQDNTGNEIGWESIDSAIDSDKHVFVFLWVCAQAMGPSYGIPANWTQNATKSADGYNNWDNGTQCYIGFEWFSPMICLTNGTTFENQTTGAVKYFIDDFYEKMLINHYSVKEALNLATTNFFGDSYPSSILAQGYAAYWPGYSEMDPPYNESMYVTGKMRVFGDARILLYQPKITLTSNVGAPTFCLDSSVHSTGDVHVWPKPYTVSVSTVPGYEFDKFTYNDGNYGQNSTTIPLIHSGPLKAVYTLQGQYSLTVSATSGGTTDPVPGTYWYNPSTLVQVTAYPSPEYEFSQWLLDGEPYSSNPTVTVTMNSSYNLQAQFYYDDTKILWMTALEGGTTNPAPGYYFYWTGSYVNITAIPDEGYHFKRWIVTGGWSIYENPYTIHMTGDCDVIAEFETDIPYHNVMVSSYNQYAQPIEAPLYIDGEYVGTTSRMYSVPEGNHTFQVPGSLRHHAFYCWYYGFDQECYSTQLTLNVTSYNTICAYYWATY